jgi:hypothetical protein
MNILWRCHNNWNPFIFNSLDYLPKFLEVLQAVEKIEEKGERKGSKSWKIHLKQIYMPYIATKPICLTDTKDRNDKCWCGSIFQTAFMFVQIVYG